MSLDYPHFAKSERKDALVPDPQEFDFSDPDSAAASEMKAEADQADAVFLKRANRRRGVSTCSIG